MTEGTDVCEVVFVCGEPVIVAVEEDPATFEFVVVFEDMTFDFVVVKDDRDVFVVVIVCVETVPTILLVVEKLALVVDLDRPELDVDEVRSLFVLDTTKVLVVVFPVVSGLLSENAGVTVLDVVKLDLSVVVRGEPDVL